MWLDATRAQSPRRYAPRAPPEAPAILRCRVAEWSVLDAPTRNSAADRKGWGQTMLDDKGEGVLVDTLAHTVEVDLNGVTFTEELVHYVRTCCERSERQLAERLRWKVDVERAEGRKDVSVRIAAVRRSGGWYCAGAADLDEFLAVRNAFAMLSVRLGE